MPTITRFEEIEAWKTARKLTRMIYGLMKQRQFATDSALRNQIQRAAVSEMSNIAEGFESRTPAHFIEHPGRAMASAGEVRSQPYVATDLRHNSQSLFEQALDLADKSSRQLSGFMPYPESHAESRRVREEDVEYEV